MSSTALAPPPQSGAPTPIYQPPQQTPPSRPVSQAAPPPAQQAMVVPLPPAGAGSPHFIRPVSGETIQGFGGGGSGQTNDGINIAAASGTPVHAADAGTVIYTGNELAAFGNLVLIRHAGGWVTAYGHLAKIDVQRGATVIQGQPIGTVGQTGSATTPQLHFEIRQGAKPVDPAPFLGGRG
jgi:murein DD-endopeptidase MepM/ murein hydrolase activator NlpD